MAQIRIYNPAKLLTNPRQAKPWTERQAAARKDQAERYARLVLEDPERAAELAAQTPQEFASSRNKPIVRNPKPRSERNMRTNISRRKSGSGNGNGIRSNRSNPSRALRINQTGVADPRLVPDLLDDVATLKAQNKKLQDDLDDAQGQLDDISDVVSCSDPDCNAEDHLADIQDILDGNSNGGNDRET